MDVIDHAIDREYHISKINELNEQEWHDFERKCKGKKVFYYGLGNSAEFYFKKYGDKILFEGVIDRDVQKRGVRLRELELETLFLKNGEALVSDSSALERYEKEDIVVLVASLKRYEEIIQELESLGIKNHYVLLIMEANDRKKSGTISEEQDVFSLRTEFAEKCCQIGISEKKIVFLSFFGTYSDHGKYIAEQLLKIRKDLDIVWFVRDMTMDLPAGMRKVDIRNWKKYIYELETAKMWVFNIEVPDFIIKRSNQLYIQVKHWASITLKRCNLDSKTLKNMPLIDTYRRNGKIMDYIFVGSEFDMEFCKRAHGFEKDCIKVGSPRSDALFMSVKTREKVCKFYKINQNEHILLYAPTFRFQEGTFTQKAPDIELEFDGLKQELEQKFGGTWNIVLRLHPGVANKSELMEFPNYIIDASQYDDSQELVAAADIVISDYSSIMFEPAFVKKPVFLFASDREMYVDKEYDLLLDYNSLPFPISESNEELADNIRKFDQQAYEENVTAFLEQYGVYEDGHASERAAKFISDLIPEVENYA